MQPACLPACLGLLLLLPQEILAETERVVGTNKGISEKPIRLKIYSPNVLCVAPPPLHSLLAARLCSASLLPNAPA